MMKSKIGLTSSALVLALGAPMLLTSSVNPVRRTIPFDEVSMTIEVNETDLDAGVILFSDTEERLHSVRIQDPSGRVIYQMTSSDAQGLGLTEMSSETAEPDIPTAFLAYPEGNYTFTGETFDGTTVVGVANLSHTVPGAPEIEEPEDGDRLRVGHVELEWELDEAIDHYWVEIEQDDPPTNFTIQLQPGVHEFKIPSQLMQRRNVYHLGVGAVGSNGNATVSVVEIETK